MLTLLLYIAVIATAYAIGSSSMALYLSKLHSVDIRKSGSKNLGASNALILMGWKAAVLVALHDILKGVLVVVLARHFFSQLPYIDAAAGVACVLGHIFPFYLKFKGGKGFASYIGMTLALDWRVALAILVVVVLVTLITDYIVVGTVFTVVSAPISLGILSNSFWMAAILAIATAVILWKHRENYVRIWTGTEIGLRRANRGDDRLIKTD